MTTSDVDSLELSGSARTSVLALFLAYLTCVVYLVWTPSPAAPGGAVDGLAALAEGLGLSVDPSHVEFGLNVVMLVPFAFLGGLLAPRLSVAAWTASGAVLSCLIESGQWLALPSRSPTLSDIFANTAGALVGALLLVAVRKLWLRRQVRRS